MTLPETLKAARIEAIAKALYGKPWKNLTAFGRQNYESRAIQIIAADPLEQIAVELVEALQHLLGVTEAVLAGKSVRDADEAIVHARAALQKAGVR